jgi:hypothetical protein
MTIVVSVRNCSGLLANGLSMLPQQGRRARKDQEMRLIGTIGTLLIGFALAPHQAHAQAIHPQHEAMSPTIQRIAQSSDLVRYGREMNNPLALIVAAQMLRDTGLERNPFSKSIVANVDLAAFPSADELLSEARAQSGNASPLKQLIDDLLGSREKGRETGPLYEIATVRNETTETFPDIRFARGKRAEVYVEGTGRLAMSVRDQAGQKLCEDDRKSEVAYCWWHQAESGSVRVDVTNRTSSPMTVRLVTN